MGKVEICIGDALSGLGREVTGDRELVKEIREDLKQTLNRILDGKIGAIREKGSTLVLCTRDKESEEPLLRAKHVCFGGLCVAIKPVVEDGDLDFGYYRIKINLDYHLSHELAAWHLEKIFDVTR